jgi:Tfp pilus assembly protein PilN
MSQVNSSMNFLPDDYVEKRQAARAAVVFIGLLLIVVGGIVGAYLFTQVRNKAVFDERDRVRAQHEDANKKIAEAEELRKQKELMFQKAAVATELMERVRRSALLGELTKLLPKGVGFVMLDLKSREAPSGPRPQGDLDKANRAANGQLPEYRAPQVDVTINLIGTAPTDAEVASYMASLQKSSLLSGVSLLYSEEFKKTNKDERPVRKFNVEMHINPAADQRVGTFVEAMPKN